MAYSSINRVVLIGRLTSDPQLRALPSGTSVCSLRIACNANRRDGNGEFVERANFFDVSVFGAAGESVSRHMRKGARVAIDGRLEWREWETSSQEHRQAVSVVADSVQFLDSAGDRPSMQADTGAGAGADAGEGGANAPLEDERSLAGVAGGDAEDVPF